MLSWDDPIPATLARSAHVPPPMPALQLVSSAAAPTAVRSQAAQSTRRVRVKDKLTIDVDLEYAHGEDAMPRGMRDSNASIFKSHLRFIVNRRAQQIGLDPLFPQEENPFRWMSEMIGLKKKRNFFETRVIEYQTGGVPSWH